MNRNVPSATTRNCKNLAGEMPVSKSAPNAVGPAPGELRGNMTKTVADYDGKDGWMDNGLQQCPHCEMQLGGEGGYHGEVYDTAGREYESLYATEPGTGPFFCADCYEELETNRKQERNQSLGEFA